MSDRDLTDGSVEQDAGAEPTPVRVGFARRLIVALFVSSVVTVVVSMAIWPGEIKLTAPLFCDDAQPDAFVVTDSYSYRPGETTYEFTMYCVGERGDATDVGFFKPFAVVYLAHTVIALLFVTWLSRPKSIRRSRDEAVERHRSKPAAGSTAGPFVP